MKYGVTIKALLKYRVACTSEHARVLKSIDPDVIIDIGANRGQFALLMRAFFPRSKIYCFEPLKSEYEVLDNIFREDSGVKCYQHAIGASVGTGVIHISQQHDSSSLLPISDLQNTVFPGTSEIDTSRVDILPLTSTLTKTDLQGNTLMKIDVQGYEQSVLVGCDKLLSTINYIYIELSYMELYSGQKQAMEVLNTLYAKGYSLKGVYNTTYTDKGIAIQSDFLLSR